METNYKYIDNKKDLLLIMNDILKNNEKFYLYTDTEMDKEGDIFTIQIAYKNMDYILDLKVLKNIPKCISYIKIIMEFKKAIKVFFEAREDINNMRKYYNIDIKPFLDIKLLSKTNSFYECISKSNLFNPWDKNIYHYFKYKNESKTKFKNDNFTDVTERPLNIKTIYWMRYDVLLLKNIHINNNIFKSYNDINDLNKLSDENIYKKKDYNYDFEGIVVFFNENINKMNNNDIIKYLINIEKYNYITPELYVKICKYIYENRNIKLSIEKPIEIYTYENLNKEQKRAYNIITQKRKNVFITGPGGVGKSYLLKTIIHYFNNNNIKYVTTAPTGVASINIGGQTLTSLFGIIPKYDTLESIIDKETGKIRKEVIKQRVKKIIKKIDVLFIDEISMVSKDLFEMIDIYCKHIRKNANLFGGIQIVLFGDFLQLGPVPTTKTKTDYINNKIEIYKYNKTNVHVFMSKIWNKLKLIIINLKESMRQSDLVTFNFLSSIRYGIINKNEVEVLKKNKINIKKICEEKYKNHVILFGSNFKKDEYNNKMLNKIKKKSNIYKSKLITTYNLNDIDKTSLFNVIPHKLELKIGARIMLIKNITINNYYLVNGDLGYVSGFNSNKEPIIKFDRIPHIKFNITPQIWEIFDQQLQPVISIKQIPLNLAWALTVHKSQGLTFHKVIIHFPDISFVGQAYVGLSRIVSLEGLKTVCFSKKSIKTDKYCIDFYNKLRQ